MGYINWKKGFRQNKTLMPNEKYLKEKHKVRAAKMLTEPLRDQ